MKNYYLFGLWKIRKKSPDGNKGGFGPSRIFLLLLSVGAIWLTIFGGLNYAGVCIPERRILSNDEKIQAAFSYMNKNVYGINQDVGFYSECDVIKNNCQYIPYANIEEFQKENENCCSVTRRHSEGTDTSLISRVLGDYLATVMLQYKMNILDSQGFKKTLKGFRLIYLNNCGKVNIAYSSPG